MIVHVIHAQLLAHALLVLPPRGDASAHSGHMLAQAEVEAFTEGGVDLPAAGRQHRLDGRQRAAHDLVPHPHQTPAPHRLDHLRLEHLRQGPPAWLQRRASGPAAWWLDPLAKVRQ